LATTYSNIYDKFVTMFTDKNIAQLTQPTQDILFDGWRNHSESIHLKDIRKDLTDRDDILRQFNADLTDEEQWLLAYGMTLAWINWNIRDDEELKASIGDRDFNITSKANMLKALLSLKESTIYDMQLARQRYDNYSDIVEVF